MSQLGLGATLPIGGSILPTGELLTQLWDPLSFIPRDEEEDYLDPTEMWDLGQLVRDKCHEYNLEIDTSVKEVYGSEVGDDRVDASLNPTSLAAMLVVQEKVVGMRTSEEDTTISTRIWNFCEVTSFVPCDRSQSYDYARRNNEFRDLGFNDSIVLRIIMDVSKGDMSHSSTPVGKMTLLGAKLRSPRAEHRLTWNIASWLQDAFLNTRLASDPKYLPGIMGGAGVPALYNDPENLYLFVRAYRGGGYQRIYGTCTAELQSCLAQLERGETAVPFLSVRMRERQEYFHGTYAEKVFIPKPGREGPVGELPIPLYEATGGQNRIQSFENRLLRTRNVITRSEAVKEMLHTEQVAHVLLGHRGTTLEAKARQKDNSSIARHKYGNALNANAALQNLLRREASPKDVQELLGNDAFRMISDGQIEFTRYHAQWIVEGGKSETFTILDLTTNEDIYVRAEVSTEESMKVPGIPLRPVVGNKIIQTRTKSKVGLYQINSGMEEWASDLTDRLVTIRDRTGKPVPIDNLLEEFRRDPEWVNDDSHLVKTAIDHCTEGGKSNLHSSVILVSEDKRLANQISNQANTRVYRLRPSNYVKYCHQFGLDPQDVQNAKGTIEANCIRYKYSRDKPLWLLDTGGLASAMSTLDVTEDGTLVTRHVHECYVDHRGKRVSRYTLTKTRDPVKLKLDPVEPVLRPRFFRNTGRNEASYYSESASGSWRSQSFSSRV